MGIVDAANDETGLEGAGVVHRVGSEVKDFKVGDRVIIFDHGCFSTRMAISAKLCAKIPGDSVSKRPQRCHVYTAPSFIRC